MQVRPVSDSHPAFKGYVDKSLKQYVENIVCEKCEKIVNEANKYAQNVDPSILRSVHDRGRIIIEKFKDFIEPMHKDTKIGIRNAYIEISNPVNTNRYISVYGGSIKKHDDAWGAYKDIIVLESEGLNRNPFYENIERLRSFAEELQQKIKPQEVDTAFLQIAENSIYSTINTNGTGFWGRFKTNMYVRKIERYAKEINQESNARQKAEECTKKIKSKNRIISENKKLQKNLENNNKQILKDILKS